MIHACRSERSVQSRILGPNAAAAKPTIAKCKTRLAKAAIVKVTTFIDATPAAIATILNGSGVSALATIIQTPHSSTNRR